MNTVDGYAMSSWESGYGDFVFKPDLSTLRLMPWHAGTRAGPVRPRLGRRPPRRRLAAADPAPPDRPAGRARARRLRRHRARVHRLQRRLRGRPGTRATATSSPANQYNVDYSLIGTGRVEHLLRRIRNGMTGRRHVRRVGQGRVQPRPARDRLPLRRRADHLRQPRHLQDRGEGDRPGRGHEPDVHGQVRRARGQLLSHPHQPALTGGRPGAGRRRTARVLPDDGALPGRPAGRPAGAHLLLRAQHQLLQALRARQLRADRHGLGPGQPHLRVPGRRPRRVAAGGEPGAGRRREPLPGRRRADRRRPARHRQRAAARAGVHRQRLRVATSRGSRPTCATPPTCCAGSELAQAAFGPEVVDHYLNAARIELAAYDAAVTDWERFRGFERL